LAAVFGAIGTRLREIASGIPADGGTVRNASFFSDVSANQLRASESSVSEGLRTSEFKFMPLSVGDKGMALNHAHLGVKPTQDWTRRRLVLNSLQHEDVNIYLVHGSLADSWNGLDSSAGIVNRSGGKAKSSLAFFVDRSQHHIIAGYYDDDVARNADRWKQAASGIKGVNDFMYMTWRQNYDALEAFANRVFAKALDKRSILSTFH
jgi:hypothetical protein